jgi:hypothetical protein
VAAHVFSATEEGAGMTEFIEPEVVARIYERAKRKCECENLGCKHVAGTCRNGLNAKSGITLPLGAETPEEKFAKRRAVCQECFQRSDSFYRQLRL